MDTRAISNWAELSDLAQQFATRNWVFRGVEVESYDLIPKIGRRGARKKLDGTELGYSADAERKCLDRFKREVHPHLMLEPRTELEWLCIASIMDCLPGYLTGLLALWSLHSLLLNPRA